MAGMEARMMLEHLREHGWAPAGNMPIEHVLEFNMHLSRHGKWYPSHVKAATNGEPVNPMQHAYACTDMQTVIEAPHFLEEVLGRSVIARHYLNGPVNLYSMNAFYTSHEGGIKNDIQSWHRDADAQNFVVLFMYLSDVIDVEDGPHVFRQTDGQDVMIFGKAGTMFFADTRHEHFGVKPKAGRRGLAWARWSTDENPASYGWDRLSPMDKNLLGERYYDLPSILKHEIRMVVA